MSEAASIDAYMGALRQALRMRADLRERILCEVEEHLREGAAREQAFGATAAEAEVIVIERFGPPDAVVRWWSEIYTQDEGGSGMWQRFTERARRVVFFAQEEATELGHDEVDTEHLLLGLVRETDSVAARILEGLMGITRESVRREVEAQALRGTGPMKEEKLLTAASKRVIDRAYEEARTLQNDYIGTEHLLLGLVGEADGLAARLLTGLGADLERTRQATLTIQEGDTALSLRVKAQFQQLVERTVSLSPEARALANVLSRHTPVSVADAVASYLKMEATQREEIESIPSFAERLEKLSVLLASESAALEVPVSSGG